MTYSLINKCAKNYYNRTFIVQVIAKNVVTCFFLRHSVDSSRSPQVPPPRQCYSPGGVIIFGFAAVPLMPPLTQP